MLGGEFHKVIDFVPLTFEEVLPYSPMRIIKVAGQVIQWPLKKVVPIVLKQAINIRRFECLAVVTVFDLLPDTNV